MSEKKIEAMSIAEQYMWMSDQLNVYMKILNELESGSTFYDDLQLDAKHMSSILTSLEALLQINYPKEDVIAYNMSKSDFNNFQTLKISGDIAKICEFVKENYKK